MNSEIQLFILWEKARDNEKQLLEIIEQKFEIIQTFCITWSPYNVSKNFTRFYGQSLPSNSEKELHCGSGEFKVIVVKDNKPEYLNRKTSKGNRTVNVNMFDTKTKLRELTGGGHKIHGTDNINETKHNIALLFGYSLEEFLYTYKTRVNDIYLKQDLVGTNGWKNFDELFHVLNQCSEYVVLRNPENISLEYFKTNKGDIDLLSKDSIETKFILGDLNNINNSHSKVDVDKNIILFEVEEYNNLSFDFNWEDEIFKTKEKTNNIYHANKENEKYIIIYHALFSKENLVDKHISRITSKYSDQFQNNNNLEKILIESLNKFLSKNNYKVIPYTNGYFNFREEFKKFYINNKFRKSKFRKIVSKIFEYKIKGRTLTIEILKPLRKVFFSELNIPYIGKLILTVGKY